MLRFVFVILSFLAITTTAFSYDWQIESVDTSGAVGFFTSIALDSGDDPHISYFDVSNKDLKYALWNGSSWEITSVDTVGSAGYNTSIVIDSYDNPHISYCDGSNGDLKYAGCGLTPIEDDDLPNTPTGFELHHTFPNPSSGLTSIGFTIPYTSEIELSIYDASGRLLETLREGSVETGNHNESWAPGVEIADGIYFIRLSTEEGTITRQAIVIR